MRFKNTLKEVKDLLKGTTYLKTCKVLQNPKNKEWYDIIENDKFKFTVACSKVTGILNVRTTGDLGRISFYCIEELMRLDKQLKVLRYQKFMGGVYHD